MKHFLKVSFPIAALAFFCLPNLRSATIINQTFSGSFPATITGTLPNQDSVLEEAFSLASAGNLTIFTTSYASGGFEPNITLYDASGNYIASSMVPGSGNARPDPTTGLALDTQLNAPNLTAGNYTVALTDWELNQAPTATNLSDGFNSNLGSGTTFVDAMGNIRSGNFALVISPTTTPEPSTVGLSLVFAAAVFLARRLLGSVQSNL